MESAPTAQVPSAPLGAVLAGGAGSRLGGEKAAREVAGRPLISYPLGSLSEAGLAAIVIAKPDSRLPALTVPVVVEPAEPRHPLLGIVAALRHASGRGAVVLPCDAPFVSSMLIRTLASAQETTAVRSSGRAHPLIAHYPAASLPRLEQAVEAGESATEALEALTPAWIEAPEHETFNVNTPEDLADAEARLTRPRS